MTKKTPKVLLIGVGQFGKQHLLEWQQLALEGKVSIVGLVVATADSQQHLSKTTNIPVHLGFDIKLLDGIDAVDIATPSATHYDLVSACLPHVDVLVEKPLCTNIEQAAELYALAKKHSHILTVAHLYLYHPLTKLMRAAILEEKKSPEAIRICFTNPRDEHSSGQDPILEWIHVFDLLRVIDSSNIESCGAWTNEREAEISINTKNGSNVVLRCGWSDSEPVRQVSVTYPDCRMHADYNDGLLSIKTRDKLDKHFIDTTPKTLSLVLSMFLDSIVKRRPAHPGPQQVLSTLQLACRAKNNALDTRRIKSEIYQPKVAIIGGGIFGAACALELGEVYETVLFERNDKLLSEASYLNQWRHHSGFHYPRSLETIQEVQLAKQDFESVFKDVILSNIDAYYAVSALGSEITRERYLATCEANGLHYKVIEPPASIVYPEKLRVCLQTDESVIDIDRLTEMLTEKLSKSPDINLHLDCEVLSGRLLNNGRKELTVADSHGSHCEEFDYIVNASYSHSNIISKWFNVPLRPMRFDRLELALYKIPNVPRFMMTILDAPFTSLTSLGYDDLFMLSHINHSVLASQTPANGLPQKWKKTPLNHQNILKHGLRYLPILKNATYVDSRIGIRTVSAHSEDFDGRPTVVTPHGFGCWSVLGGKIVTAVTNAREIASAIARESGINNCN